MLELVLQTVIYALVITQILARNVICNLLGMKVFNNVYSMDKFVLRDNIIALPQRKHLILFIILKENVKLA